MAGRDLPLRPRRGRRGGADTNCVRLRGRAVPGPAGLLAVGVGVALPGLTVALVGPPIAGEWHYWPGGGLLAGAAIVLVVRRPERTRQ